MWRESCGFEAALAAISSLDAAFSPNTGRKTPSDKNSGGHPLDDEKNARGKEATFPTTAGDQKRDTVQGGAGERAVDDGVRGGGGGDGDGSVASVEEECLMEAEHFRVIQAAVFTLVASASAGPVAVVRGERLVGCRANRRYLRREISYDSLACCLVNSGVVARYVRECVLVCVCMYL